MKQLAYKGAVWKKTSLSESFGRCWANNVKINALDECQPVVGDSQPKYEPFITHNGAL